MPVRILYMMRRLEVQVNHLRWCHCLIGRGRWSDGHLGWLGRSSFTSLASLTSPTTLALRRTIPLLDCWLWGCLRGIHHWFTGLRLICDRSRFRRCERRRHGCWEACGRVDTHRTSHKTLRTFSPALLWVSSASSLASLVSPHC